MSSRPDSPEPIGYDVAAAERYFAAEAEKKRKDEAELAAEEAAEAERLAKNTNMQELDGGAKRKRTKTKKMRRRHKRSRRKRKSHRKSKRVMKK